MRRFDAEYLRRTRLGMWDDSREALAALELAARERVLDVGCGTGELTRVLREETPGEVVGCDADPTLLAHADPPVVAGDAYRLPFADDAFDLVVCQALLVNLREPTVALEEFARVSRRAVAVIEPDNGRVSVASTVAGESSLAARAREHYLAGVETDATLGATARRLFDAAGIDVTATARYDHERTVAHPYDDRAVTDAGRKASGADIEDDRGTLLSGGMTPETFDRLRERWREMGRSIVAQMQDGTYERRETIPFFVTVGEV